MPGYATPYTAMLPPASKAISSVATTAPGAAIPGALNYLYGTRGPALRRRDPELYRLAQTAHRMAQGDVRATTPLLRASHRKLVGALKREGLGPYLNYFAAQSQQMPGFREFVAHGPWSHAQRLLRTGYPGPIGPAGFQIPPADLRKMIGSQAWRLRKELGAPVSRAREMSLQPQYASWIQKLLQFFRGADIPLKELIPFFFPSQR